MLPLVVCYVAAGACWLLLARATRGAPAPGLAMVLAVGALARAIVLFGAPILSDDLWRFLWDGRVLLAGHNPYLHAPDAPELRALRDITWTRINYPEIRTIYPPGAQVLFGLVALLGGRQTLLRVVVAVLDLVATAFVARVGASRDAPQAGLLYALSPLAVVESALSAHVDGLAAVLLLAAALCVGTSGLRSALALGGSIAIKVLSLLALPAIALARPRRRALLAAAGGLALAGVLALPFVGAGWRLFDALSEFAIRWEANASLYALLEPSVEVALRPFETRPGAVHSRPLGDLSRALTDTPFDPRRALRAEKKEEDLDVFETTYLASIVARLLVTLAVLAIGLRLAVRGPPLDAVLGVMGAALLLGPVVHPWYVLWLVPLAVVLPGERSFAWLLFACLVPLAYLPLDRFRETGEWIELLPVRLALYLPVFGAIVVPALRGKALWRMGAGR